VQQPAVRRLYGALLLRNDLSYLLLGWILLRKSKHHHRRHHFLLEYHAEFSSGILELHIWLITLM